MALVVKDRVRETTTTTGTGTVTLAGAVDGFQSFSAIGDGNTTYYAIVSGNNWETGLGTYTASGTTLSRDTILESSNSGSAITLAGTSDVFVTFPAEKSTPLDSNDDLVISNNLSIGGQGYSPTLTLTDGATINWDTDSGQVATVTLAGNRTFAAPTNLVNGGFYALEIVQDGTGSRTATWNSVFKFTGATAPTLTTTASAKDYLVFRSDGTNLYEQGRSLGVG